jgi:hypothetical protein
MLGRHRLWILATCVGVTAILWVLIPKYTLKSALMLEETSSIPSNMPDSRKRDLGFRELSSGQDPIVEYVQMHDIADPYT